MTIFALTLSILIGVGSLAFAYYNAGYEIFTRWLLIFGGLWLFAIWQRWRWFSSIGIFVLVSLAGYGLWNELSPAWMLTGALGGLFAWDLTDFLRRLRFATKTDDRRGLQRRHLTRLLIVALIGVTLFSIATLLRLEFTFEGAVLLTLIAAFGVTQLVAWLRRGG
jgi:hypothetical protein